MTLTLYAENDWLKRDRERLRIALAELVQTTRRVRWLQSDAEHKAWTRAAELLSNWSTTPDPEFPWATLASAQSRARVLGYVVTLESLGVLLVAVLHLAGWW